MDLLKLYLVFGMMSISLKVSHCSLLRMPHNNYCCCIAKTFVLYVGAPSCEDILNVGSYKLPVNIVTCTYTKFIMQMSERLFQVLREWFNSVCDCDGLNNLYSPQVICVDDTVGKVTSTVHSDNSSDKTAQMLIDLAKNAIQSRDPAQVEISSDWIICLSEDCGKTDGGEFGMPNVTIQDLTLYIKNISCNNVSYISS